MLFSKEYKAEYQRIKFSIKCGKQAERKSWENIDSLEQKKKNSIKEIKI